MEALLYIAPTEDVVLIDIPTSITAAHGFIDGSLSNDRHRKVLLSKEALEQPFPSTEPKTEKAKQKILETGQGRSDGHADPAVVYQKLLRDALTILRGCHAGEYCHPRKLAQGSAGRRVLQKHRQGGQYLSPTLMPPDHATGDPRVGSQMSSGFPSVGVSREASPFSTATDDAMTGEDEATLDDGSPSVDNLLASISTSTSNSLRFVYYMGSVSSNEDGNIIDLMEQQAIPCSEDNPDRLPECMENPIDQILTLNILDLSTPEGQPQDNATSFYMAPRSFALLSRVDKPLTFRNAIRSIYEGSTTRVFNFILLDPPWPNRSAKRRNPYASHNNKTHLNDIQRMLLAIDLETYLIPGGYIAVWITNKAAVREAVLGRKGLFARWNVQLVEEWIYLKVTRHGEPVTSIDGVWRKPYEVCLVGQAPLHPLQKVDPVSLNDSGGVVLRKRRVIAAVPDMHSRKPCLKGLIERWLGFTDGQYEALEVFARYSVKGWWGWGDETLKFSHVDCWIDANENDDK